MGWNGETSGLTAGIAASSRTHGRQTSSSWAAERLTLFDSGRSEVAFSDGSGVILHPAGAERITYFRRDGARQRLLASCLPKTCSASPANFATPDGNARANTLETSDDVKAKVCAAAALRDRFHPQPTALPLSTALPTTKRHLRLARVSWPLPDSPTAAVLGADRAIEVNSLEGDAKLSLAPHGRTFVVEWWCPLRQEGEIDELLSTPSELQAELPNAHNGSGRIFSTDKRAVAIFHQHVRQIQCFSVEGPSLPAWAYPLLLALRKCSEADHRLHEFLGAVSKELQAFISAGSVVETGAAISACLPLSPACASASRWSSDDITPAAAAGTAADGEGPVTVVWTPGATIWTPPGSGEATIDISFESNAHKLLISSQQGRFWKCCQGNQSKNDDGSEFYYADLLPPDAAGSCAHAVSTNWCISEALRWLRHNSAEAALSRSRWRPDPQDIEGSSNGFSSVGWSPDLEVVAGGTCLTVFRPYGTSNSDRRFVRILFKDGARMEFAASASQGKSGAMCVRQPADHDHFRLLDGTGAVLQRTFSSPLGAEREAAVARAMLLQLALDPDDERQALAVSAAMVENAQRHTELLLLSHGVGGSSSLPLRGAEQSWNSPAVAGDALHRCREACQGIETVLSRQLERQCVA